MKLTIIKWRDIPAQVVMKKSRKDVKKVMLSDRFQEAIDLAATVGGAADTDAYLADWNNEIIEVSTDDMEAEVNAMVAELEDSFTEEELGLYVQTGGYAPEDDIA